MEYLVPSRNSHKSGELATAHADVVGARARVRRTLTVAGVAAAIGAAVLLVLGVDCAIYLALSGEPPSLALVLHQAPRWFCGLLRTCSV
jgi:hypothetical protein